MREINTVHYFNQIEYLPNHIFNEFYQNFFEYGQEFFSKKFSGQVENFELFCKDLEENIDIRKCCDFIDSDDVTKIYYSPGRIVSIFSANSNKINIDLATDQKDFLDVFSSFVENKFQKVKEEQQIHMIAPDEYSEQVSLYPMGEISSPLNRDNYNEEILKKVDFVIKELNSENPLGRMVLIDGPPGCGKSYLIRGMLKELNYGVCVLVPVSMLESLDKPTLIPLLMKYKRKSGMIGRLVKPPSDDVFKDKKGKPIILIIEDADSVLVPRQADNMSEISSLLNYTDGIFGSLFDLRIIATTNAPHVDIEKALLRPGRLLKRIHIDYLKPTKAEEIYKNLTGQKKTFEKEVSLATVYSMAKGNEPDEAVNQKDNVVGFQS